MELRSRVIRDWPKLAWVARCNARDVEVLRGPMVECAPLWCVEAVWDGPFEDGDFDRTDAVYGSGIRLRGDHVVFVSGSTTFDRLWHCRQADTWTVSNSLPALLAAAGLSLRDDHAHYTADIQSITRGINDYPDFRRSSPISDNRRFFSAESLTFWQISAAKAV